MRTLGYQILRTSSQIFYRRYLWQFSILFSTFYAVAAVVDAAQLGALETNHIIVGEELPAAPAAREPRIDVAAVGEARVLYRRYTSATSLHWFPYYEDELLTQL